MLNVPKKNVINILLDEVLDPFFIYIVFAMAIFIWEHYFIYGGCIIVLSGGSILMTVVETKKNNE